MAVPVHERTESQLSFLANAESLQDLTNKIVMNEKYVPKRYRYVWTQEVFKLAMNIFENVRRANIIYPKSQKELDLRLHYLTLAETDSEALLSQTAFARKQFSGIPQSIQEEWEKLCVSTKKSIRKRRNDDVANFRF